MRKGSGYMQSKNVKNSINFFIIILLMSTFLLSCSNNKKEQVYSSTATGYGGDITVNVTITENRNVGTLLVDATSEDPSVGQVAARRIAKTIVAKQSLKIDAISGATKSSEAVLKATEAALGKAGIDTTTLKNKDY